jgi:predicted RNA-binding Zn-ribbon protein involved in translation (DUF1610 family)
MICLACEWNAPYVIQASFCPNCGEDGHLRLDDRFFTQKAKTSKSN